MTQLHHACLGIPGCSHPIGQSCDCKCHNTLLKTWQEEQDEEFYNTFIVLNSGQILFRSQLKPGVVRPAENMGGIISYIHSREEDLLKRIGEEVENMGARQYEEEMWVRRNDIKNILQ